jgi:hypothetical protein
MQESQKLRVLIPHWVEHNQEHAREFLRFLDFAGDAAPDLKKATEQMNQVNQALMAALEKLGGSLSIDSDLPEH